MRCLFAIVMSGSLCSATVTWAQMDKASAWTLEARVALNGSFGPSEEQAEIAGGRDTMSRDDKMHYTTGFLPSSATEIAIGYQRGALHHRLVLSYFLHEWGMSSPWGYPEVPLATADMFGIRLASALRLTGREDRWAYGFKTGLFISFTLPVSIIVEQAAMDAFGLQAIHGDVQFNWGTE